ncbi:hypothetical protein [Streptomyces sp. NPDC059639]|uniref:hypothetical protein n=1 Tax=Streptomyces sp. NPDC059639 TaxID=3346891 RepID=UPI0036845CAF
MPDDFPQTAYDQAYWFIRRSTEKETTEEKQATYLVAGVHALLALVDEVRGLREELALPRKRAEAAEQAKLHRRGLGPMEQ